MCAAYLAFVNPQTLQAKSATFFLLNSEILENISGSDCNVFVSCGHRVCLIDKVELVEISRCCKLNDIHVYGSSKDPSY